MTFNGNEMETTLLKCVSRYDALSAQNAAIAAFHRRCYHTGNGREAGRQILYMVGYDNWDNGSFGPNITESCLPAGMNFTARALGADRPLGEKPQAPGEN